MTSPDYEAEYNNELRVPDFPAIAARWQVASDAYRKAARCELDLPYGSGDRQRYDLFFAGGDQGPLVVYLHGGYWQGGDRSLYSFVAKALNESGIDVAIPSYSLCPNVTVAEIVEEMRLFHQQLWARIYRRPRLIGHSAGGHLTAAMLATDWRRVADVPSDLVRAGMAISGIFELEPLIGTSISRALRLDPAGARAVSPRFWAPPPPGARLVAVVGEHEGAEFHRQSRELAADWRRAGVSAECVEIAGANHFTLIDELVRAGSPLHARALRLAA